MNDPQEIEALANALLDEIEVLSTDVQALGTGVAEARDAADQARAELKTSIASWETELQSVLDEASAGLESMYEMVQALSGPVAESYALSIEAAGERLAQTRSTLDGLFSEASSLVTAKLAEVSAATTVLSEVVTALGTEQTALVDQLEADLTGMREAVVAGAEAATQAVDQQRAAVEQTLAAVDTQQRELGAHIESEFVPALAQTLEEFSTRVGETTEQVVVDGIAQTRDAALETLDGGVKAVVDQTVEELLRMITELSDEILHGSEGPQQKSAAMREVVDLIRQLIDPIVERVTSVRSLAASVGISV